MLIEAVHELAVTALPLDRLSVAAAKGAELAAEADALIDHFVAEARRGGCSWTEIGERLGVTKQAVRERFGDRVEIAGRERFMPRLRRCVSAAGELAQRHGAGQVGTVHLLLALAANEGVASSALDHLGVTPLKLETALGSQLGEGPAAPDRPPESPELGEALRAASALAFERGYDYVGTEHVLFVLATETGAHTRRTLEHLGVDVAAVKRELECFVTLERPKRRRGRRRTECRCSFCGTAAPARLVQGPGVWICHGCAQIALDITKDDA